MRNRIFQFTSVGEIPQDRKYGGEATALRIGDEPLWRDERATVDIAGQSLSDLTHEILTDEANMGPYYLAAHVWLEVDDTHLPRHAALRPPLPVRNR